MSDKPKIAIIIGSTRGARFADKPTCKRKLAAT